MLTTKHASGGFMSMRDIVELMLPLVLGVLAIGMSLMSYQRARFHHGFLSFFGTNKKRTR
jgi:hypothetical protein